jgi:hypothetical protein
MISQPQMRMLHAAARDGGLGHDDLKASALKMFGAESLKDLLPHQAGQMIDDLLAKSGKPKPMPEPIKPLYTKFPTRASMVKAAPPDAESKQLRDPASEPGVFTALNEHYRKQAAPRLPRPFGGKVPPLVLPAPAPVVTPSPPPVRIQKPSTAKEPHVQTGGYGKLAPAQYRPKPPSAPVEIRYDSHGRALLSPDEIPF